MLQIDQNKIVSVVLHISNLNEINNNIYIMQVKF